MRPRQEHAALRPRHSPSPRTDAGRRPAAPRACLQPAMHAAGNACYPLWRRNRDGRQSRSARAQLRPHADAMVDRASCRIPCLPVIDKGPYGYEHVNVAKQRRDPNSLLNWTERIIRMRKEVPEIGWGDFKVIAT